MAHATHSAGLGPMASENGHGALAVVNQAVHAFNQWLAVRRQRKELLKLDDRLLSDIGLNRAEAMQEYNKSHWVI